MNNIKTTLEQLREKLQVIDWKSFIWAAPGILITGAITLSLFQGTWSAKNFSQDILTQLKTLSAASSTNAAEKETPTNQEASLEKATGADFSKYEDGEYKGEGEGFAGTIGVTVTIASSKLENVEVTYVEADDEPFFNKAKGVIEKMISSQKMEVDVVAGATYSSKGIIAAVKNALTGEVSESQSANTSSLESPTTVPTYTSPENGYLDGTYEGVGIGFGGEIKVSVLIEGGKFTQIQILSSSGEGSAYLSKAQSLIPLIISQQSTDVDAVSGATYTSNGLLAAIQDALSKAEATKSSDSKDSSSSKDEDSDDENNGSSTSYKNGTYLGSATGYGGEIKVKVLVAKKKITSVSVTSAKKETPSFLKRALVLTDTIVKKQTPDVDVVAGATYTSNGIKAAVKNALAKGPVSQDDSEDTDDSDNSSDSDDGTDGNSDNNGGSDDSDSGSTSGNAIESKYKDGTFTGYGTGFMGKNSVKATVIISSGKITKINITSSDTEEYLAVALDILGDLISKQKTDGVDVISGATFSSEGILEAVSNALKGALNE